MGAPEREPFEVESTDGTVLRGWTQGDGPPILLAHGLTAHRDLVVHGSNHLARAGFRLVAWDARGHGESEAAGPGGYDYPALADDLEAVAAAQAEGCPLLAGHSMGAHTSLVAALRDPAGWSGLVLIGPVSAGEAPGEETLASWDTLATGLERGGVEGWLEAYAESGLDPEWRETLLRIARERMERHRHPQAVADALRAVPRSVPYEGLEPLAGLELETLVVASHDDADPGHPHALAEQIAAALPSARLIGEEEGESPLAWQGGKLSREIEGFARSDRVAARLGETA